MASQEPDATHDARVFGFTTALKRGDEARLRALLAADPGLATSLINSRTPLHLFADSPGHRPNPAGVVSALAGAGADLDAHAVGSWHRETPLHWAASNDDVDLIDALLDAGADIEHPGSSIGGGPPAESALGYGQYKALRRLQERGATMNLSRAAALGLMPLVTEFATATPPPGCAELAMAFWNACRAGQLEAARYLAGRGADLNWHAPWSGETPLEAARRSRERAVVAWLTESGAELPCGRLGACRRAGLPRGPGQLPGGRLRPRWRPRGRAVRDSGR
jgi:ankyrin repeat protein